MKAGPQPTRRNTDLRRVNSLAVLDELRDGGRRSRAELGRRTTLSPQALATILNDLVETGHVLEVDVRETRRGPGRPALHYEFNPRRFCVVALYIGLRYSEISICDALGNPICDNIEFHPGWSVDRIIDESAARIGELRTANRVDELPLHLAAVVHGSVHADTGAVDIQDMGWSQVPLGDLLSEKLGAHVTVHDASRSAALAESREGFARGISRVVILNFGPDITATYLIDGAPDVGATGLAGRIGRARIEHEGETRTVDELASSFAIKRRYAELSGRTVEWANDVARLGMQGDPHAEEAMTLNFASIAYASMWLITIMNPERFIVTGAAAAYHEPWRNQLRTRITSLVDPNILRHTHIEFSALGRQAWIRGGVHAALDHQRSFELSNPAGIGDPTDGTDEPNGL